MDRISARSAEYCQCSPLFNATKPFILYARAWSWVCKSIGVVTQTNAKWRNTHTLIAPMRIQCVDVCVHCCERRIPLHRMSTISDDYQFLVFSKVTSVTANIFFLSLLFTIFLTVRTHKYFFLLFRNDLYEIRRWSKFTFTKPFIYPLSTHCWFNYVVQTNSA